MGAIERLIEDENGPEFRVSGIKFRFINSQYSMGTRPAKMRLQY